MTQRTRYFLVSSGLVIVVGLGTGLVAYYNGRLPGRSALGPEELAYIPSDATALAYADVREIMGSEFRQKLQTMLPTGEEKDRLLAETGVDVERDIDSVVASVGPATGSNPVVLLRGRFDEGRIQALAVQHGATVEQYNGKQLLLTPASASPSGTALSGSSSPDLNQPAGIALLEPGLIALGDRAAITRAIDVYTSHDAVTGNTELMKFVADVQNTGNAWVVGRFDAVSGNSRVPDEIRKQLPPVQWFALSADVNQSVTCHLHAEARDAQSGEEMRTAVNGAIAAAKLMTGQNAEISGILNSIQSSGTGTTIDLAFTVPSDIFKTLPTAAAGSAGAGTSK